MREAITATQLNELTPNGRDTLWEWYERQPWFPIDKENSVLLSLSVNNKGRCFPFLTIDQMRKFLIDINAKKPLSSTKGQWLYTEAWLDSVDKKNWCDQLWEKVKEEINF